MKKILIIAISFGFIGIAHAVLIDFNEGLGHNPGGPFPQVGDYYSYLPGHPIFNGFTFADYSDPIVGFDSIYGPHSPWGLISSAYPGTGA